MKNHDIFFTAGASRHNQRGIEALWQKAVLIPILLLIGVLTWG